MAYLSQRERERASEITATPRTHTHSLTHAEYEYARTHTRPTLTLVLTHNQPPSHTRKTTHATTQHSHIDAISTLCNNAEEVDLQQRGVSESATSLHASSASVSTSVRAERTFSTRVLPVQRARLRASSALVLSSASVETASQTGRYRSALCGTQLTLCVFLSDQPTLPLIQQH
jgi:hypothetical protein